MTLRQMDIWEYMSDRGILYGKTSQELSVPTVERTLGLSSKKSAKSQTKTPLFLDIRVSGNRQDVSWETDGVSLGEHMMHNTGEFRKDEREFVFSLISGGGTAGEILFELQRETADGEEDKIIGYSRRGGEPEVQSFSEGLRGDIEKGERKGEEVTGSVGESVDSTISFQERAGKAGGVKESLSKTSEPERSVPCQTSTYCIEGNVIDREAKQNGKGWKEEESYTLNSTDRHGVVYGVDAYNHTTTGDVTMSITGAASDPHHIPCVIEDVASCVASRDYKSETDLVCFGLDAHNVGCSEQKTQTLTAGRNDSHSVPCVYGQSSFGQYTDGCGTLKANGGDIGGGSETLVIQ